MQNQTADVTWRTGDVPVSTQFDDPYFSLENGLAETRYVFLEGNGLPARFRDGFHVAELGFGTGLNFLATLQAWKVAGCTGAFHFTSFEAFPMTPQDMAKALAVFEGAGLAAKELAAHWRSDGGTFRFRDTVTLNVVVGDARIRLPDWHGRADAWFLDGFSPAKNPELWEPSLMAEVARHTATGGSFATYTAAGFVRRSLSEAGFEVQRVPGYGRKRHMSRGLLRA
ncbi:MAG: tRNA (5-methylaminomethyl-2-thiouridine)(34)-methyltransferase MnmD [Roseobacter sp.]|nr:tRNA (5-methylaminomethyl-2-thiouridine)(34)-methyltransferase MnmD [Roseobacter sp.]